jgi:hypothetical protein
MESQITRQMLYSDMSGLSTCEFGVYNYPEWKSLDIGYPLVPYHTYNNSRNGVGFYGGLPMFWRGRCLDWFHERWGIGKHVIYKYPIRRVEFVDMVESELPGATDRRATDRNRMYRLDSNKLAPLAKVRGIGAIPIIVATDTWNMLRNRISELAIEWAKLPHR